jgi:hypothetical protein
LWIIIGVLSIFSAIFFSIFSIFLVIFFPIEIYENGIYLSKPYKSLPHLIKHKEKVPFFYFDEIEDLYEKTLSLEPGFFLKTKNKEYLIVRGNINRSIFDSIQDAYDEYKRKIDSASSQ